MIPSLEQEVRGFIIANFLFGQNDGDLRNDDSFLEKGIIDSTGMLELVAFLEEKFKIIIKDEELMPDNLDSIHKLVEFVKRKMQ